jgi:predicted RNA-binding protein with PIN domain
MRRAVLLLLLPATTAYTAGCGSSGLVRPLQTTCVRCVPPQCMPKGDGKKSRPKQPRQPKDAPDAASDGKQKSDAPPQQRPAGRITQDSLLSVRRQIGLVREYKRRAAATARPAVRTSFRKKRDITGGSNRTAGPEVEVDLTPSTQTKLFVDGYNVINAWPRLKKPFLKGDLLRARELLLDDVADYAIGRFNASVVFDANGMSGVVRADRFDEYAGGLVQIVFAHDSADAYIERETRQLRADGQPVQVATSDNGISTACSSHGALVMSSDYLVKELKASRKATGAIVDDFNKRQARIAGRGPTLWDAIDKDMRDALVKGVVKEMAQPSRRDREAKEAMQRAQAAGELPQLRRAALGSRRRTTDT